MHKPPRSIVAAVAATTALVAATAPAVADSGGSSGSSGHTPTFASTPKFPATNKVIVVMKDQATAPGPQHDVARAAVARAVRQSVAHDVVASGGKVTHRYSLINGFSATVSSSEAGTLAANPNVAEVVPDEQIKLAAPRPALAPDFGGNAISSACPSGTQLEPEALESTRTDSSDATAKTARSLGFDGTGVTVAYLAGEIDTQVPDFIRAGKSVFTDYKDFSGDGTNVQDAAGTSLESFLDAGTIAAQGATHEVSTYSGISGTPACTITLEGFAPGANVVGLSVFNGNGSASDSMILNAINYAVTVDHVNVLNESLGANPFPDSQTQDLVKQADLAAVKAGTLVVTSSGDSGVGNTIGSPASSPGLVSVGATTTLRPSIEGGLNILHPQIKGWLDNQIAQISSTGIDQANHTITLVAPGDNTWTPCSTATMTLDGQTVPQYPACTDAKGDPAAIARLQGTSESAPTVSAIAALVIQAYRKTHAGATPSPAEIERILTSTADDVDAPADQQGVGLVDAYKAVELAESTPSAPVGDTLTSSAHAFAASGAEGSKHTFTDTITNSGADSQTLSLSTRTLGAPRTIKQTTLALGPKSTRIHTGSGTPENEDIVTFTVPKNADRLDTALTYKSLGVNDPNGLVTSLLLDPNGNLANQGGIGVANYSDLQVTDPTPGTWTEVIYSLTAANGGVTGKIPFLATVASYQKYGTVSPAKVTLAPGKSAKVTVNVATPGVPSDRAGSLVIDAGNSATTGLPDTTTIPITMRSVVPAGTRSFTGSVTGGNGDNPFTGPADTYLLTVPKGAKALNARVLLDGNRHTNMLAELIDPNGNAEVIASNERLTDNPAISGQSGVDEQGAQLHVLAPKAGRWELLLNFAPLVSGRQIRQTFTVNVDETPLKATATGLPTSKKTTIVSGKSKVAYVSFKNTTGLTESLFLDPRTNSLATVPLAANTSELVTLPQDSSFEPPVFLVPTHTTALHVEAITDGKTAFSSAISADTGDPEVTTTSGLAVTGSFSAPTVAPGDWAAWPTEIGPFSATGAPQEDVLTAMVARTRGFDTSVVPATGDLWRESTNPFSAFDPVVVGPGETATIPVRIHATGKARVVHGTIYVDAADLIAFAQPNADADELAALPYTYRVVQKK